MKSRVSWQPKFGKPYSIIYYIYLLAKSVLYYYWYSIVNIDTTIYLYDTIFFIDKSYHYENNSKIILFNSRVNHG